MEEQTPRPYGQRPKYAPEDMSKLKKIIIASTASLALGITGITGFFITPQNSQTVVRCFGEYVRTEKPGPHFNWPYGIETTQHIPVTENQQEEFGFRTIEANKRWVSSEDVSAASKDELENIVELVDEIPVEDLGGLQNQVKKILQKEYLMLTGDLNMADVEWIVQYNIKDPVAYAFNIAEQTRTLRDCSLAVMREIVGNGSVDEVITIGRLEYQLAAKEHLQKLLDSYESGIEVITVQMQSSNPPRRVRPSFNAVNEAMQQKETKINTAMGVYNEAIPKTRGTADQTIKRAEGYALERVNTAKGDVAKYNEILVEYQQAPELTKERMWAEVMTRTLPKVSEKLFIEQKGAEGGILQTLDITGGKK